MPATLDQAFKSPFHNNVQNYYGNASSISGSSMDSIKNPDYSDFQRNYRVKKAADIQSEADELKSVYDEQRDVPKATTGANDTSHSEETHDCNYLIAKLLSCSHCRNRIKELLSDSDRDTVAENEQTGGGNSGSGIFRVFNSSEIVSNIILGILLLLIIDFVFKLLKT